MPQIQYVIHDLTWDGRGVARDPDGRVAMITGALPGDTVTAILLPPEKKGPLIGRVNEIVTPSPDRIPHPCTHHLGDCLTSPLGAWRYKAALNWKTRHLVETLRRIGKLSDPPVTDPLVAPSQWGYRERLELHLFNVRDQWLMGYLAPDTYSPLRDCLLGTDPLRQGLTRLVFALGSYSDDPGLLNMELPRENGHNAIRLLLRDNGHKEAVAVLFVQNPDHADLGFLRQALANSRLAGWQIRHSPSIKLRFFVSQILDDAGDHRVFHKIGPNLELSADPTVFSQVNRPAAIQMTARVLENLPAGDQLLDLYGGYGAFGLEYVLSKGERATIVESSIPAVRAGRHFAQRHDLPVEYLTADLGRQSLPKSFTGRFGAAVMDPPRGGANPELIIYLNENGPASLIYISCHPAALARDLKLLSAYQVQQLIPVDLFPQTPDLETVAVLSRN